MVNSVYVLTREINQYDQDGEYFVTVFQNKPTVEQLKRHGVGEGWKSESTPEKICDHVLNCGGGRIDREDTWWYLRQVKFL